MRSRKRARKRKRMVTKLLIQPMARQKKPMVRSPPMVAPCPRLRLRLRRMILRKVKAMMKQVVVTSKTIWRSNQLTLIRA